MLYYLSIIVFLVVKWSSILTGQHILLSCCLVISICHIILFWGRYSLYFRGLNMADR